MNKQPQIRFTLSILTALFFNTSVLAFSTPPEDTTPYSPADWSKSNSAENDAKNAIEHNDLRLLGFAGRGTIIPGVDYSQVQDYSDKCGVRFFDEFADVIKEREQLEQMKRAKEYAGKYNTVILTACKLSDEAN